MNVPMTGTDVGAWRRQRVWDLRQTEWWQKDVAVALGVSRGAISHRMKMGREDC
jgi:predicted XRE-type DNA-binding protein